MDRQISWLDYMDGSLQIHVCVTSTGEILINMYNDNKTRSKVAPYLGSKDKPKQ